MTASGKYDEWALHAYVDGEVAGESCAEIEAHLRANPEDAARVDRDAVIGERGLDGVPQDGREVTRERRD